MYTTVKNELATPQTAILNQFCWKFIKTYSLSHMDFKNELTVELVIVLAGQSGDSRDRPIVVDTTRRWSKAVLPSFVVCLRNVLVLLDIIILSNVYHWRCYFVHTIVISAIWRSQNSGGPTVGDSGDMSTKEGIDAQLRDIECLWRM